MDGKFHNSAGITLIELILSIAIIGILSVIAVPKYINLKSTAQTNTTNYIAAALSSANAENYAARIISTANGIAIKNCRDATNMLQGGLPSGYTIKSKGVALNATITCTLTGPSSTKANFFATGIR